MRIQWVYLEEKEVEEEEEARVTSKRHTFIEKTEMHFVNLVNMWVMTMITIVILDELLLWMRCCQLRREAREAMNRLIEVLETQNNEHLYSTIL